VNEAEIADDVDDPEVLVSRGGLHDLLSGRQFNQGRVLDPGANGDNVLRVVLHRAARGILRDGGHGTGQEERGGKGCNEALAAHE
jgi:hypothetical protein